jgi:hypothetical protein
MEEWVGYGGFGVLVKYTYGQSSTKNLTLLLLLLSILAAGPQLLATRPPGAADPVGRGCGLRFHACQLPPCSLATF